jgi:type IV secretion system protein VirB11
VVPLLYARGGEHAGKHTAKDLVEASLRLRPDRIILGELRGAESFDFLHAINTGHPGSIATLHANTPAGALKRLSMMVLQARTGMTLPEIDSYVRGTVDVIVHVGRTGPGTFGVREVYFAQALDCLVGAT